MGQRGIGKLCRQGVCFVAVLFTTTGNFFRGAMRKFRFSLCRISTCFYVREKVYSILSPSFVILHKLILETRFASN
jgi:hypothetical protein